MIITFRVSNFLSFNEEVEFSMLAGKVKEPANHIVSFGTGRTKVDVLRVASLYGANASGKSNLIKAVDFAKHIVVKGLKQTFTKQKYFRLQSGNQNKSSRFEFEFITKGKIFAYGYEVNLESKKILEEWLFEVKKASDKPIFERRVLEDGTSEMQSIPSLKGESATRFDVYVKDILPNQLLLTEINSENKNLGQNLAFSPFKDAFEWIDDHLIVFYPSTRFGGVEEMSESGDIKEQFCHYLEYFNTGIVGIESKAINADNLFSSLPDELKIKLADDIEHGKKPTIRIGNQRFKFNKNKDLNTITVSKLLTKHTMKGGDTIDFEFEDESDGTQRIFDIVPLLILLSENPSTVFIDEIDRSLHPELTRKLLEVFLSAINIQKSQLIITTHESSLLDLALLRRDEIWFVEKNTNGESRIYSLEEFKPRFDKEIRKAYLQGRFGAIPFIADINQLGWRIN